MPGGCWELSTGVLEEQPMLLTVSHISSPRSPLGLHTEAGGLSQLFLRVALQILHSLSASRHDPRVWLTLTLGVAFELAVTAHDLLYFSGNSCLTIAPSFPAAVLGPPQGHRIRCVIGVVLCWHSE